MNQNFKIILCVFYSQRISIVANSNKMLLWLKLNLAGCLFSYSTDVALRPAHKFFSPFSLCYSSHETRVSHSHLCVSISSMFHKYDLKRFTWMEIRLLCTLLFSMNSIKLPYSEMLCSNCRDLRSVLTSLNCLNRQVLKLASIWQNYF